MAADAPREDGTVAGAAIDVSVVVPMRDAARYLPRTLPPLLAALPPASELIVCDDGSTDASAELAAALGCRVVRCRVPAGAASARNRAAAVARGRVLVFIDADVCVRPETLPRLLEALDDPAVDAAFGSYDDDPPPASVVSVYKNLAHHFVHQRSSTEASTFWSGCGAIRSRVFAARGGFDARVFGIEDVELGYRLREHGHSIRLVPAAQVTHLKEWTLGGWLISDVCDRAMPWARLVRSGRGLPRDLNFRAADRFASLLVLAAAGLAVLAPWLPALAAPAALAAALALVVDRELLAFLARRRSMPFAIAAAGLQLLHRLAGLAGFIAGWGSGGRGSGGPRTPRP